MPAGAGMLKRAGSAEAESPPNARLYTARLRSAAPAAQPSGNAHTAWPLQQPQPQQQYQQHQNHHQQQQQPGPGPGQGRALNPKRAAVPAFQREASEPPPPSGQGGSALAAPSVDAASEGPIKKRFKVCLMELSTISASGRGGRWN